MDSDALNRLVENTINSDKSSKFKLAFIAKVLATKKFSPSTAEEAYALLQVALEKYLLNLNADSLLVLSNHVIDEKSKNAADVPVFDETNLSEKHYDLKACQEVMNIINLRIDAGILLCNRVCELFPMAVKIFFKIEVLQLITPLSFASQVSETK